MSSALGTSPSLTCTAPELVGAGTGPHDIESPALTTEGLILIAGSFSEGAQQCRRSARGQAFGAWSKLSTFPTGDATFFRNQGKELAIVATQGGKARHLRLCPSPSWTCTAITLRDASTGQALLLDVDGPEVIQTPGGSFLMVHNVGPTGVNSADIYLAHPTSPGQLLDWTSQPIPVVADTPSVKEDDPGLSPDGLTLLFSAPGPGLSEDLWVSRRSSLTSPFPRPVLLSKLNSTSTDASPSLAAVPAQPGHYEVFFSSDRPSGAKAPGSSNIYRSTCAP